jgi:hypothetical protein
LPCYPWKVPVFGNSNHEKRPCAYGPLAETKTPAGGCVRFDVGGGYVEVSPTADRQGPIVHTCGIVGETTDLPRGLPGAPAGSVGPPPWKAFYDFGPNSHDEDHLLLRAWAAEVAMQIARDLSDEIRAQVEKTMKEASKDTKNLGLHYRVS